LQDLEAIIRSVQETGQALQQAEQAAPLGTLKTS